MAFENLACEGVGKQTLCLILIGEYYNFCDAVIAFHILCEIAVGHLFSYLVGIEVEYAGQEEKNNAVHPPQAELEWTIFLSVGFVVGGKRHELYRRIS